jgi:hypothetical protein
MAGTRKLVPSLLLAVGLAGCGATDPQVKIDSDPADAVVYIDGERRGTAGNLFTLPFGGDVHRRVFIQVRKPGSQPREFGWLITELPSKNREGVPQKLVKLEAAQ